MCGTRSPSRRGPVTEARAALIVAHGAPSSPGAAERAIRAIAARVEDALPGWSVRGATLMAPAGLEAALAAVAEQPLLVFPYFMANGRFARERLPRTIRALHAGSFQLLRPLGLDPALHRLCLSVAQEAVTAAGLPPGDTVLLLAGHGSPTDPRPCRAVEDVARLIRSRQEFREVRIGFLDQPPLLKSSGRLNAPAICLPFFAGRAGHVEVDLPAALAAAGFEGPLLAPIGLHPRIPAIIAAALRAAATSSFDAAPTQLDG